MRYVYKCNYFLKSLLHKLLGFEFSSFFWLNRKGYHYQVEGVSTSSPLVNEIQANHI